MAGKILRCDHDGCDAVFPPAPVRGYRWPIRAEAEKVGWVSSRTGLYAVDDDADRSIKDYCPEHAGDLDPELLRFNLDRNVTIPLPTALESRGGCVGTGGYPNLGAVQHADRITVTVNTEPIGDLALQRVMTRPQDWSPAARAILFPEAT